MFRSLLLAGLLLLAASPVLSQEERRETPVVGPETGCCPEYRLVRLQHIDPASVANLFGFNGVAQVRWTRGLNVIAVSGPPPAIDDVVEAVRELDQPGIATVVTSEQDVMLTVHLIGVGGAEAEMPEKLQPVVRQLEQQFPYSQYRLLESFSIRAHAESKAAVEGVIPAGEADEQPMLYTFGVTLGSIQAKAEARSIRITELRMFVRAPIPTGGGNFNYADLILHTSLDLSEDKLVVIGKAGSQGVTEGIFAVLEADVVE